MAGAPAPLTPDAAALNWLAAAVVQVRHIAVRATEMAAEARTPGSPTHELFDPDAVSAFADALSDAERRVVLMAFARAVPLTA